MLNSLNHRLEELILASIIILNVLEFFNLLTADLGLIKTVISWSVLAYLMIRVGLTRILFGNEEKVLDCLVVLSYFLLILKNLVVAEELGAVTRILVNLEYLAFITGGAMLVMLSLYMALRLDILAPSVMSIIHEEGHHSGNPARIAHRSMTVFLVLSAFFVVVFNFVMEWLAMMVDAPLAMLAILAYVFLIIRHHQRFDTEHFIYRIGNIGEGFYQRFIQLFIGRQTVFLGISGILVLHLLTDLGNFLLPYILGMQERFYLTTLGLSSTLYSMLSADIAASASILEKLSVALLYFLNVTALVYFLISPALIWYGIYSQKGHDLGRGWIILISASLASFFLAPVFRLISIQTGGLAGVSFTLRSIHESSVLGIPFSLCLVIICGIITSVIRHKKLLLGLAFSAANLFFAWYLYLFTKSLMYNYWVLVSETIGADRYFAGGLLVVFAAVSLIFYAGGFLIFLGEARKDFSLVR